MRKDKQTPKNKEKPTLTVLARLNRDTKTHHRTGYHKPIKNPTTNAAPDGHKAFCKRCMGYNAGKCPVTGTIFKATGCSM